MKKKEALIIFVLAGLFTAINLLRPLYNGYWKLSLNTAIGPFLWFNFPLQFLASTVGKFLLPKIPCVETPQGLLCPSVVPGPFYYLTIVTIDFLFWFLVLAVGWWMVRWVRRRYGRNK